MISYKSKREVEKMRASGHIVAQVFDLVRDILRPGITTLEIDAEAEKLIRAAGGTPSFKGYHGFPCAICASVNDEIVHGIPGGRSLKEGDLFSVDVGVVMHGYHGDAARSFAVGSIPDGVTRLMKTTQEALQAGIDSAVPGNRLSDIAKAIEAKGRAESFGIVEEYVGHGIGTNLHEDPQVPNFVSPSLLRSDLVLKPGLVLALEPMFNLGSKGTRTREDGWTVVTSDGSCSAHFEDTVAITEDGPQILTRLNGASVASA